MDDDDVFDMARVTENQLVAVNDISVGQDILRLRDEVDKALEFMIMGMQNVVSFGSKIT